MAAGRVCERGADDEQDGGESHGHASMFAVVPDGPLDMGEPAFPLVSPLLLVREKSGPRLPAGGAGLRPLQSGSQPGGALQGRIEEGGGIRGNQGVPA